MPRNQQAQRNLVDDIRMIWDDLLDLSEYPLHADERVVICAMLVHVQRLASTVDANHEA